MRLKTEAVHAALDKLVNDFLANGGTIQRTRDTHIAVACPACHLRRRVGGVMIRCPRCGSRMRC
jgi:Zn finger protein HypA/HybF involved in hydrogenase expression